MRTKPVVLIVLATMFALVAIGTASCGSSNGGGGSANGGQANHQQQQPKPKPKPKPKPEPKPKPKPKPTTTTTQQPPPTTTTQEPTTTTTQANCTPGYSPCLTPASDYDCQGGTGDGPEYTGQVQVTGSDPYGLDTDSDGVGCE
jgi:hypothetical protein